MTVAVSAPSEINLLPVIDGLAIVERIVTSLSDVVELRSIDQMSTTGNCPVVDIVYDDLLGLRDLGHLAELRIREGTWSAILLFDGPVDPSLDVNGLVEEAFSGGDIPSVQRAVVQQDAAALFHLGAAAGLSGSLHILVRNSPTQSGSHWAYTLNDLEVLLNDSRWVSTVSSLGQGPRLLSVSHPAQLGPQVLGQLLVRGTDDKFDPATVPEAFEPDRSFRTARALDGRVELPSPLLFSAPPQWTPGSPASEISTSLRSLIGGVVRCLVWYWLSTSSSIDSFGSLDLRISGARMVSLSLRPLPADNLTPELSLYVWAANGDDPSRREAVEQAASLAITQGQDLATAASPALRTARSLYELARRGAVSEALATRRSAREAALAAARGAADAARDAAGKSIERTLVQIAAVVGVALTDLTNVISPDQAIVLLSLVGLLSVVFLIVTTCFSLRSASAGLAAELKDLDQYREALASDDLDTIRGAATIAQSRSGLKAARLIVIVIYGVSVLAACVAIALVTMHTHQTET